MSVRRQKLQKWLAGILVVAGLLSLVLPHTDTPGADSPGPLGAFVRFMDGAPSPVPLAALFLAVGLVSTLVHELGHALAARSLVDTDVLIRIGDRVPLGTVRFGRVAVDLNAIATPRRAAGVAYADLSQATPRDMLLIALAGPAASLAQVPSSPSAGSRRAASCTQHSQS